MLPSVSTRTETILEPGQPEPVRPELDPHPETTSEPEVSADTLAVAPRIEGVVLGELAGFAPEGQVVIRFDTAELSGEWPARSLVALTGLDLGCQVACLFENQDPTRPLVLGKMHVPAPQANVQVEEVGPGAVRVRLDSLRVSADREIVLECGKSSITLTREGKVLLRGAYILSRSSGANRIKGGSVQIN